MCDFFGCGAGQVAVRQHILICEIINALEPVMIGSTKRRFLITSVLTSGATSTLILFETWDADDALAVSSGPLDPPSESYALSKSI
jgi:hypothetical protein